MKIFLARGSVALAIMLITAVNASAAGNKQQVIDQVRETVEQEQLVSNPSCTQYLFTPDAEKGLDLVDVMEKHGGKCGLDPQVQHRLFSVYVDQQTQQMLSDKDDPENGTLKLLSPP